MLPPPPPPPPSLPSAAGTQELAPPPPLTGDRNALLSQIRKGAKLKKAVTNDRSAPVVNGKTKPNLDSSQGSPAVGGKSFNNNLAPGLGGLFAQGMPKLRPTKNSFLQGGAYRSQLDPRESLKRRSLSKSCDDLGTNSPVQPSVPSYLHDQGKQASGNSISSKAFSIQNLNNSRDRTESASKSTEASSDVKPKRPEPPPASKKPNFNNTVGRSAMKSFLHADSELGGSEPNLSLGSKLQPKPPETPVQSFGAPETPMKPGFRRSYEDTDVPNGIQANKKSEKLLERTLKYNTLKNTSMPSNLNGRVVNGTTQSPSAPVRRYSKNTRPVKPSVAPPPVPVRAATPSQSPQTQMRHAGFLRGPPPPPPLVSPPPPPPRNQKNTLSRASSTSSDSVEKHDADQSSGFEARFKFRDYFELPKPDTFLSKPKTYPSKAADARMRRKLCPQPPSVQPPPPPVSRA